MYTHVWVVYYWCLSVLSVILQLYYDYQILTGEGWWGRGGDHASITNSTVELSNVQHHTHSSDHNKWYE